MIFNLKITSLVIALLMLTACGNTTEVEHKLDGVSQCIQAPDSIRKSYELATSDGRIPVYLSYDSTEQYSGTDWYKADKEVYDAINWDLENWSTISDLSECDQALKSLETDYAKDKSVIEMRRFLGFAETVYKMYGSAQIEDASIDLFGVMHDARSCLLTKAYPQAFITMNYDMDDKLFPMAFAIDWDGDDFSRGSSTADGRNPLWRPISPVKDTGCLERYETLPQGFVDWALSSEDDLNISWSDYAKYKARFEEIASVVDQYNDIVAQQHSELKAAGETIPPKGPYTAPIIHKVDNEYFSDYDFKQLLTTCQSAKPETFVNGRGETLTSPSQECNMVQTLCNKNGVVPPLDKEVCAPYIYK